MSEQTPGAASLSDAELEALSFEDALGRLEAIVRQLEGGTVKLDDAVGAYEQGVKLKQLCEKKLAEARLRVERISVSADGKAEAEPFDPA